MNKKITKKNISKKKIEKKENNKLPPGVKPLRSHSIEKYLTNMKELLKKREELKNQIVYGQKNLRNVTDSIKSQEYWFMYNSDGE